MSCPECHLTRSMIPLKAPLVTLLVVGTNFKRIGMGLVGLLEKMTTGYQYIQVIVVYAEAILL